eukprot:gene7218-5071_t
MSAKMQVPLSQRRHTNIAVVRYTKNGVKLEIACYKNKVISYRSGVEDRLDEVLQVDRIFSNVARGFVAPEKDIQAVFGKDTTEEEAIKFMLVHGELQVAQQERTAEVDELFKDISVIISQKCVNEATQRPFPVQVIEQSLRSIGAAVKLDQPVKKQALSLIHQLIESQIIPIVRAKMKVRCTTPSLDEAAAWCVANGAEVLERCDAVDGLPSSLLLLLPPHLFRVMENFVNQKLPSGSALHMVDAAVMEAVEGTAEAGGPPVRSLVSTTPSRSVENASDTPDDHGTKKQKRRGAKKGGAGGRSHEEREHEDDLLDELQRLGDPEDSDSPERKGKKGKKKRKGPVETPKPKVSPPEDSEEDSDAEVEGNRRQRKKMNTKRVEQTNTEFDDEMFDYGSDEEHTDILLDTIFDCAARSADTTRASCQMDDNCWKRGSLFIPSGQSSGPALDSWEQLQSLIAPMGSLHDLRSATAMTTVPPQAWNDYWIAFSDRCGDRVDGLQEHLGKTVAEFGARRVDVFLREGELSVSWKRELLVALVFYARQIGAVEHVHTANEAGEGICSIHFTSVGAADLFTLWIGSWKVGALWNQFLADIPVVLPSTVPYLEKLLSYIASNELPACDGHLEACLVPINSVPYSRLILGFNVFLATPFLRSLFCGMMGAVDVEFSSRLKSFEILFPDSAAARLALHALQASFWRMFGLSLLPKGKAVFAFKEKRGTCFYCLNYYIVLSSLVSSYFFESNTDKAQSLSRERERHLFADGGAEVRRVVLLHSPGESVGLYAVSVAMSPFLELLVQEAASIHIETGKGPAKEMAPFLSQVMEAVIESRDRKSHPFEFVFGCLRLDRPAIQKRFDRIIVEHSPVEAQVGDILVLVLDSHLCPVTDNCQRLRDALHRVHSTAAALVIVADDIIRLQCEDMLRQRGQAQPEKVLVVWVPSFAPPSQEYALTAASVAMVNGLRGVLPIVCAGVAVGMLTVAPWSASQLEMCIPVDVALNVALGALTDLFSGEWVKGHQVSATHIISVRDSSQRLPAWNRLARYVSGYYKRHAESIRSVFPEPDLLAHEPCLKFPCSIENLTVWRAQVSTSVSPLDRFYSSQRTKELQFRLSEDVRQDKVEHLREAVRLLGRKHTTSAVHSTCSPVAHVQQESRTYEVLLRRFSGSYRLLPLLLYLSPVFIDWEMYVGVIARAALTHMSRHFLSGKNTYDPALPLPRRELIDYRQWKARVSPAAKQLACGVTFFLQSGLLDSGRAIPLEPGITPQRIKAILVQPEVQRVLTGICLESEMSKEEMEKKATKILLRIGDNLNDFQSRLLGSAVYSFFSRIYEKVEVNRGAYERLYFLTNLQRVQVVLVLLHRSYVDFMIMSLLLGKMSLTLPHIVSGEDFLRMGFLASFMRGTGAFFMRRSFRGDQLYTVLFKEYVRQLVLHGQMMEFFIEGARSRTGKTLLPKMGILKFVTDAFLNNQNEVADVLFVPISLSYDQLLEAPVYARELLGVPKPKETIMNMLKGVASVKQEYGSIHINVGDPISLQRSREEINQLSTPTISRYSGEKFSTPKPLLQHIAVRLIRQMNSNVMITPSGIFASAMETMGMEVSSVERIPLSRVIQRVESIKEWIMLRGGKLSMEAGNLGIMELVNVALKHLSSALEYDKHSGDIAIAQPEDISIMTMHMAANQLMHLFVEEAMLTSVAYSFGVQKKCGSSTVLLVEPSVMKRNTTLLRTLLSQEFVLSPDEGWFERSIKRLTDGEEEQRIIASHKAEMAAVGIPVPMTDLYHFTVRILFPNIEALHSLVVGVVALFESFGFDGLPLKRITNAIHRGIIAAYKSRTLPFALSCALDPIKHYLDSLVKIGMISTCSGSEILCRPSDGKALDSLRNLAEHTPGVQKGSEDIVLQDRLPAFSQFTEINRSKLNNSKPRQLSLEFIYEANVCSSMLENFKVFRRKAAEFGFSVFKLTIRFVYFSDEVSLYGDALVRFILSTSNIPVILLIWSATHSILQCVVWMLIVPVVQEAEDFDFESHGHALYSFFAVLGQIGYRIAPFVTVCVCAASAGTKMVGCFGSAMVDANASLNGMDYPLMRSQLIFMSEKPDRFAIWSLVVIALLCVLVFALGNSVLAWFHKEPKMFFFVLLSFLSEAVFVLVTMFRGMPSWLRARLRSAIMLSLNQVEVIAVAAEAVDHIKNTWWVRNIYFMRSIALSCVGIGMLYFCCKSGAVHGVTLGLIMLMSFGFPHIFVSASLHAAAAIIRTFRSFSWLHRHPDATILVVIIGLPYQVVMSLGIFYFLNHPPILLLLVCNDVLLIAKAIDLVREFDVSEHGSVHWRYKKSHKLIPPIMAILLEDAYEKKQRHPGIVSLDMSFDVVKMQIVDAKDSMKVTRVQVLPYGASRRFRFNMNFYLYTVPRLLSLQNRGDFSGAYFRVVRIVLRVLIVSTFVTLVVLVGGIIIQASFPVLRAPAVRATLSDEGGILSFDHVVVRLFFLSKKVFAPPPFTDSYSGKSLSHLKWDGLRSNEGEDFYPQLCQRDFYGSSVLELAILSLIPYLYSSLEMETMIHFLNDHFNSDWLIRERHGTDCETGPFREPSGWNGFADLYSPSRNLTVISIRGTDMFSFKDFVIDMSLYFETILYQFAASSVPGAILTPKNLVEDLIWLASIPPHESPSFQTWEEITSSRNASLPKCQLNNYRRDFFIDIYNHLAYVGSHSEPSKVLLVGHSMGGSIAAIIGSQMHIQAVSFSAPGILLARKKYHLSALDIHRFVTSVVSSNDLFPSIGRQGGELHHIVCLSSTKETCHALEFIVGTLWRSCGTLRAKYPLLDDIVLKNKGEDALVFRGVGSNPTSVKVFAGLGYFSARKKSHALPIELQKKARDARVIPKLATTVKCLLEMYRVLLTFCSSIGRACDCRKSQVSQGRWFDSGRKESFWIENFCIAEVEFTLPARAQKDLASKK